MQAEQHSPLVRGFQAVPTLIFLSPTPDSRLSLGTRIAQVPPIHSHTMALTVFLIGFLNTWQLHIFICL